MINKIDDELIRKMVEAIVEEVQPEQVFLFGSRATGAAREDSDIDILVVEREGFGKNRSRLQETNRINRALTPFRIPTDVLVYSSDETDKWRDSINHVVGRCMREGILLYAVP